MKRVGRLLTVAVLLIVLAGGASAGAIVAAPGLSDAAVEAVIRRVEPGAPAAGPFTVVIPEGSSGAVIAGRLAAAGLVRNPLLFRLALMHYGAERDLKAGRYTILAGTGLRAMVDQFRAGAAEETVSVTIPEGLRAEEIAGILEQQGVASAAEFLRLVRAGPNGRNGPSGAVAGTPLEGFLFPDTYHVPQIGRASCRERV